MCLMLIEDKLNCCKSMYQCIWRSYVFSYWNVTLNMKKKKRKMHEIQLFSELINMNIISSRSLVCPCLPWKAILTVYRFLNPIRLLSYLSFQHQVLSLPVLEHLEGLQSTDDVNWVHCCFLADLCAGGKGESGPAERNQTKYEPIFWIMLF